VRQHVVHLDRNRRPFRASRLPDHQMLCRLGLPYLLAQGRDEPATGTGIHP
jgi:hypothetical protein